MQLQSLGGSKIQWAGKFGGSQSQHSLKADMSGTSLGWTQVTSSDPAGGGGVSTVQSRDLRSFLGKALPECNSFENSSKATLAQSSVALGQPRRAQRARWRLSELGTTQLASLFPTTPHWLLF